MARGDGDEVNVKTTENILVDVGGVIWRRMGVSGEIADDYRVDGWLARGKGHGISGKKAIDYWSDGWRARGDEWAFAAKPMTTIGATDGGQG